MMMRSTLSQINICLFGLFSASSLKQQPTGRHVAPLRHIILIPSLCSFSLMLCAQQKSNSTHDLPHARTAHERLHCRCCFNLQIYRLCTICTQPKHIDVMSVQLLCQTFFFSLICCLHLVYPMLPISLHCPFLISPSVFSNVQLRSMALSPITSIDCTFGIL